jgi:two-component system, chemotaxis family, chemotaxis protein CheY
MPMPEITHAAQKALIVDDDPILRGIIKQALKRLDITLVYEAGDGANALELMRSHPPSFIICDVHMQPMGGLDFVRNVRALSDAQLRSTPIVMVTGDNDMGTVRQAATMGISGYLLKPISFINIKVKVEAILLNQMMNMNNKSARAI